MVRLKVPYHTESDQDNTVNLASFHADKQCTCHLVCYVLCSAVWSMLLVSNPCCLEVLQPLQHVAHAVDTMSSMWVGNMHSREGLSLHLPQL